MSFSFTPEREEFRRVVASFLQRRSPEQEVRRLMATPDGYDREVWDQMAGQLGLQGLVIPEQYGGSGQTVLELAVVMEEMGRALLCAPYLASAVLATFSLLYADDEAAAAAWLPGLATGEVIGTLALTDDGRCDETGVRVSAHRGDRGWVLNGVTRFVLDGTSANLVIVAARAPGGITLYAVERDAAGLTRDPMKTMDETRKLARLGFEGTPAVLVGREGAGMATMGRVMDVAAVALAAEQVGGAQQALDMAVDYAKLRYQFGRPIGSFQAIKHKCADVLLGVESAKSAVAHAAWCAVERPDSLPEMASLAQAHCSEVFFQAAAESVQVHGGVGFTWEHPAHLFFKRAKSSEMLLGDPAFHREQLAQRIAL